MSELWKTIVIWIIALIFSILLIYGMYWIVKTVSYAIFYEGMVKQTITEMVRQDSLK